MAPLGALIGAIVGAAAAESAETVEEAEAAIKAAFAAAALHESLRDRVLQVARAETRHTFVPPAGLVGADASLERPEQVAGPVDTVLQVTIQSYGTKVAGIINDPPVFLFLDVQVSLLRAADGTLLYRRPATWVSAGRPVTKWGATQGEPVRQELERGIQYLAERIVDVVFLLRPFR